MYMSKTYPVAEARRQLSALIERAASGRGPVYIGRRGRAEVALVAVDKRAEATQRSLRGLCTLGDEELARPDSEIAATLAASLARTEAMVMGRRQIRQRAPRRRTPR